MNKAIREIEKRIAQKEAELVTWRGLFDVVQSNDVYGQNNIGLTIDKIVQDIKDLENLKDILKAENE